MASKVSRSEKIRSAIQILIGGNIVGFGMLAYTGDDGLYRNVIMPIFRLLDAETAHKFAVKAAKYGFIPRMKNFDSPVLETTVFGLRFSNPLGIAAGFDKHGEAVDGLLSLGFGFVEVGSVTPLPQEGNPKPRVFRLIEDGAVINRYGFNSDGHDAVYDRLINRKTQVPGNVKITDERNILNENFPSPEKPTLQATSKKGHGIIGINLGKNKTSSDAVGDYVSGVQKFGALADYLVINISSPNTPGLRAMQGRQQLKELVEKVVSERNNLPPQRRPPILVKIAPDLTEQDKIDIAAVVGTKQSGIDGLIVSNTTVGRPDSLKGPKKSEIGGLSGTPLKEKATMTIRDMYRLTYGRLPIIGVGGIGDGEDAYEKIKAGASLIQIYTAFSYHGPTLIPKIKKQLADLVIKDGYQNVSEAVGVDFKSS